MLNDRDMPVGDVKSMNLLAHIKLTLVNPTKVVSFGTNYNKRNVHLLV